MKKLLLALIAMAMFTTADAQFNLGNLAKKAAKTLTKTAKSAVNETINSALVGVNPFKDQWRIDSIKAVGVKTSNNFGKVYLVINAEAIVPLRYGFVGLGGTLNQTYAVIDGKTYKPYADVEKKFEMPEGVPMVINTQGEGGVEIKDVPVTATAIQAYNMYIYIDGGRHQTVLWKNIPITWTE
ncbi:MAG: hypothetical protein MJY81_07375 [Bacteroidaceae bacterium]|nr:hypothetical protein [Bacteroidaceae bacterium]